MHEPPIASPFGSFEPEKPIPASPVPASPALLVIACLFLISGIAASIESLVEMSHLHLHINLVFVNSFIGIGLLCRKPCSLQWALLVTEIGLVLSLIGIIFPVFALQPNWLIAHGHNFGRLSVARAVVMGIFLFALLIWQFRVLSSPATRQLFVQR